MNSKTFPLTFTVNSYSVQAIQWFKDGDSSMVVPYKSKFRLVITCDKCDEPMQEHGVYDKKIVNIVCPGDFIVDNVKTGQIEYWPKNKFLKHYSLVNRNTNEEEN